MSVWAESPPPAHKHTEPISVLLEYGGIFYFLQVEFSY